MAHAKKCWARAHVEIMKDIPPLNISYINFLPKKLTYFHIMRWSKNICSGSNLKFQLFQTLLSCKKWLKRVWWFMYENYFLKNTWKTINYFFFFNKVQEKKITEKELILLLDFKKKKKFRVCITFIVFMIKLANLKINYQRLSLSLNWTC